MKKHISVLLAALLVLSVLSLTSCGGGSKAEDLKDSKYVGTWMAQSISIGGSEEKLDQAWLLELKEDGTGTLTEPLILKMLR